MRVLLLLLTLLSIGQAQDLMGKYLLETEDTLITVFLQPREDELSGGIMLGYGFLLPISGTHEGHSFTAQLDGSEGRLEGEVEGDSLTLTLVQEGEQETWTLQRQRGEEAVSETDPPLLHMLALVPDTITARQGVPGVSYANYTALGRGYGITTTPEDAEAAIALWRPALMRVIAGPNQLLQYAVPMMENMPELVGFGWHDIHEGLTSGQPPNITDIFSVTYTPEALAERLEARDFEREERQEVMVWHRGEDARSDLMRREMDPFVGALGMATRIALFPGYLTNSRYWFMADMVIDTYTLDYPSLAQAADYHTLADALTSTFGSEPYQVLFFSPLELGLMPDDPLRVLNGEAPLEQPASTLPLYSLVAFADFQQEEEQVNVIALLYEDRETATLAATSLAVRMARFDPQAMFDTWGVQVDEPQVHESEAGLFAAMAAVRYPISSPPAAVMKMWVNSIYRREFTLLASP